MGVKGERSFRFTKIFDNKEDALSFALRTAENQKTKAFLKNPDSTFEECAPKKCTYKNSINIRNSFYFRENSINEYFLN